MNPKVAAYPCSLRSAVCEVGVAASQACEPGMKGVYWRERRSLLVLPCPLVPVTPVSLPFASPLWPTAIGPLRTTLLGSQSNRVKLGKPLGWWLQDGGDPEVWGRDAGGLHVGRGACVRP